MKSWWDTLQTRERLLVAISAALLLLMIVYLFIWEPMNTAHKELTDSIAAKRETLSWMHQNSRRIKQLQGSQPTRQTADDSNRSMLAVIDKAAKQHQLRNPIQRMEPDGNDAVKLWMENTEFDALIRWLGVLRRQHGIKVTRATINQTGTVGQVDSRLSLSRS